MAHVDVELDHTGFIVTDLERGAAQWARLGFTLTPKSAQMGLNKAGEFEPWATANHCAVFEQGYLELIGVHRPECFNPWTQLLHAFEGAHIAAFKVCSADATFAELQAHTNDFLAPVARRRDAPFLYPHGWGEKEMRFRNIFSDASKVAEARYILIEHQTPDVLWQPKLLQHDNGAIGFVSMSFCSENPADCLKRLGLLGMLSQHAESSLARIDCTDGGFVEVLSPSQFVQRYPGMQPNAADAISSCTVQVANLQRTREHLRQAQIDYYDTGDGGPERIWIAPSYTNGTVLEFIP
jgi:hypothetical protein